MKNIAIYSRKSCVTDTGESIQNQINICKEYIFTHIAKPSNCSLTIYKDEGFSAKNTDRPEFQKMIKNAENRIFSHIVCYRLDRISRNIGDFSKLIEKLSKMNISFVCVKEQFDTSVPMGRAMMYIASVFAQLERETIAERVKDNMMMLSKHGQWLGGTTPLGLKSYRTATKNSKYKFYLQENDEEIIVVKDIFRKFLEYKSLTKTKQYLDNVNLKSRNGNKFSTIAIKKILSNPVYCCADKDARDYFEALGAEICFSPGECNPSRGIISYNKRNYRENNGKDNPICSWVIALGSHNGIIKGENWIEINKILNCKEYKKRSLSTLFAGKIICKICNSKMLQKKRKNNRAFDYICANKIYHSTKNCSCKNLNGNYIDKLIISQIILKGIKNNSVFIKKLNILKNNLKIATSTNTAAMKTSIFTNSKIINNINKNSQICLVKKIIDSIFWNNVNLDIKLKNCNL